VEIGSETHACIPCFTVKPHILDNSRIVLDAVTLNKLALQISFGNDMSAGGKRFIGLIRAKKTKIGRIRPQKGAVYGSKGEG
jgi:hypothetical protein